MTTAIEKVPTEEERIAMLREGGIPENKYRQLAIASSITLKLLAVDLASGAVNKTIELAAGIQLEAIHSVNSYASPTPIIDENKIYCHFGTYGTFCVDRLTGELVSERRLPLKHSVGPGSSPFIHHGRLILIQDGLERQYVAALDKATERHFGKPTGRRWKHRQGIRKKHSARPSRLKIKQDVIN